jgi:hypothetical protein
VVQQEVFYLLQRLLDVVFLFSAKWKVISSCLGNTVKVVRVFLCVLPWVHDGQFASK